MDGVVDQIKQKLDILEVLGEYIKLTKAGRNWKARCPFHHEKSASFMVSPERQIWHCFGCGQGGDIFGFVMRMEGVEFGDALRILARRAGVQLQKQDPQAQSQRKRLYDVCELATRYFETQLEKSAEGQNIQKYLLGRGLKPETIKEWRLGWSRNEWRALSDFLRSRGYSENEMLMAGLIVQKENSSRGDRFYDRFRSRIMFPIFDTQNQVIAFGGRIFGQDEQEGAKYLNSPQTPLYDKSRVLYGLSRSKNEIRIQDRCILVEGYMDLLMTYQAGFKNVVASSGTALTEQQLAAIGRYTRNLYMAFDSDIAGDTATKRSIDLALKQDFNIRVISMKDKDPADVVKRDPAEWSAAVENAQSIMDFYFISAFSRNDASTMEGRRKIKEILLPVLKALPSRSERGEWLSKLAGKLRVDEKDLAYDLEKVKVEETEGTFQRAVPLPEKRSRQEGLEERVLGLCLAQPEKAAELSFSADDFQDGRIGAIFNQLKEIINEKKEPDLIGSLRKRLSPELVMRVDYISLKIQQFADEEPETLAEMEDCLKELRVIKLRKKLASISYDIKDAQVQGDKNKLRELLESFSRLSTELIEATKNN